MNPGSGWPPFVTWLWIAIGSIALAWLLVVWWWRRSEPEDMGTVSQQWLAEHRATEHHYSGR